MPPIWSVESDDPNLAAVLERLVDIKKGNTLVRCQGARRGALSCWEAPVTETPCDRETDLDRAHLGADSSGSALRSWRESLAPNPARVP